MGLPILTDEIPALLGEAKKDRAATNRPDLLEGFGEAKGSTFSALFDLENKDLAVFGAVPDLHEKDFGVVQIPAGSELPGVRVGVRHRSPLCTLSKWPLSESLLMISSKRSSKTRTVTGSLELFGVCKQTSGSTLQLFINRSIISSSLRSTFSGSSPAFGLNCSDFGIPLSKSPFDPADSKCAAFVQFFEQHSSVEWPQQDDDSTPTLQGLQVQEEQPMRIELAKKTLCLSQLYIFTRAMLQSIHLLVDSELAQSMKEIS